MTAPPPLLPRLMRAEAAARYLGISATKFRQLQIPRKILDGCVVWDRLDLDAYAEALPYEGQEDAEGAAWDRALG